MKLLSAAAAIATAFCLAGPASAAVTVVAAIPGYQGGGAGFEGAAVGALTSGYSEAGITFTTVSPSVQVKQMPSDGDGAFPFGDTSTKYVSVLGGATLEMSFGSAMSKLGFYWGSIDGYNSISFYKGGSLVETVSGSVVLPSLVDNGGQASFSSNRYVTLVMASGVSFDTVRFSSSSNSFEFDNIAAGVPEPSTWAMMLLGFAGLSFASYRRSKKAVAAPIAA
ncbi:MAG: hypothetical protein BGP06_12835 [Rhizobiales bacterium 65-9]|nr:PEP-CTERM sorting domain-containing protein [Hyphomicrobiales bacterium]OJY37146.1 MAG: hypothetical protein BGP06_12835 [Rhizobiales bacterium 65-9]